VRAQAALCVALNPPFPLTVPSLTVSRRVSHSVRNWPISFSQAGSYSAALMASRTYARSSFSVVLTMAYRSERGGAEGES